MQHSLVSHDARALVAEAMGADRILITGASGWLGRTALDLIAPLELPTLALASRAQTIHVADRGIDCQVWDDGLIADFAPTVILDCAFLTRDRVAEMPLTDYIAVNRTLTERLLFATRLPGVRLTLTVSSGAAIYPNDALSGPIEANPYGYLKREAEKSLSRLASECGVAAVVARAWSISGAHVQKPQGYALGSMILAASQGRIHVRAKGRVYRRYVLAEELLALGIAEGSVGSATIDSGGELIEMGELARRVAAVVRPDTTITRDEVDSQTIDNYHSDGLDWDRRCRAWGLTSASLDRQIDDTMHGLFT